MSTWIWLSIIVLIAILILIFKPIVIPENQYLVVSMRWHRKVLRILPSGFYFIFRPFQTATTVLNGMPRYLEKESGNVRTADGITLSVRWRAVYRIDPHGIPHNELTTAAEFLANNAEAMMSVRLDNAIRQALGRQYSLFIMNAENYNAIAVEIRGIAAARLPSLGLSLSELIITAVLLPAELERAILALQSQPLNGQAEAAWMETLRNAARLWSQADREWLAELEEISALGENNQIVGNLLVLERVLRRMRSAR